MNAMVSFFFCHTYNGKIRMKKSAQKKNADLNNDDKDEGIGNWITITIAWTISSSTI